METDTLVAALRDAGLSTYQTDAYVTVLELGAASATEIAATSDVPDPRIYDVLRALEEHGYVETYTQGTLHARAHDPQEALADLRGRAQRFVDAADEIEERWQRPALPRSDHEASVVSRFETVLERAQEAIATAEYQVRLSVSPAQFESLAPALESAFRDDVVIQLSIHTHPDETTTPNEETLAGRCTETRYRPLPAPFLALVDRTVLCYAPHAESAGEYGMLVDDRTHAYVFYWYFLTCLWLPWDPLYTHHTDISSTRYVDIRQFIRETEPQIRADGVEVTVEGRDTATGEKRLLKGRITDATYPDTPAENDEATSLVRLAGRASVTLETAERTYSVGGWGAILEDLEATYLTVMNEDPQA